MISKTHQVHPIKQDQETFNKITTNIRLLMQNEVNNRQ